MFFYYHKLEQQFAKEKMNIMTMKIMDINNDNNNNNYYYNNSIIDMNQTKQKSSISNRLRDYYIEEYNRQEQNRFLLSRK